MLAGILHKHTARCVLHTAVNVAKIGGSMRNNENRCYTSENLPAVAAFKKVASWIAKIVTFSNFANNLAYCIFLIVFKS